MIERFPCLLFGGCSFTEMADVETRQILVILLEQRRWTSIKKIGIVGYWATSISTVRSTVLSKKSDRYGFISGFGH